MGVLEAPARLVPTAILYFKVVFRVHVSRIKTVEPRLKRRINLRNARPHRAQIGKLVLKRIERLPHKPTGSAASAPAILSRE
jgi:hypothetical protein